ncbi:MAG TPA: nicotinate phosphoribosyltransferase [Candidatus Binatia bacterium]|nr:nicotinate phosphoribosyltransferase [Candidatus Binatia bacterium]
MPERNNLTLLTDLYQLTMAQSYFAEKRFAEATFSVFVRSYPPDRGYFVCAGLDDVLDFLEDFAFDANAIEYLAAQKLFSEKFLRYLSELRFTGDVWAIPEGRIVFKEEPLLELSAPIIQAQIVETLIINQLHLQTMIATKAARCVHASGGRPLVDFALRRTHGTDAGMKVARASYLAGFVGTSNVMAGKAYGIPIVGTMAHSFISSFEHEIDAFRAYVRSFPHNAILLIDTYDTLQGARNAVQIAKEMATRGETLIGVRLDSGDLADLARQVRKIFDDANLPDIKIIGSGGLDEYDLAELAAADVPFDSYGIGTRMGTSADAPWMDMAYKLVEYNRAAVLKLSTGKASSPGRKQIFRTRNERGNFARDTIGLRGEQIDGETLLKEAMDKGRRTAQSPSLSENRKRFAADFAALPDDLKALRNPPHYAVDTSQKLAQLREQTRAKYAIT